LKAWRIPLGFLAFSLFALAIFAAPVWYGWHVNVGTLRVFVPEDMRALPELFHREGPDAVAAAIRSRSDPSGREVIAFAGPGKAVLAGTLRRWPSEIPDAPGTYGHVIDGGDGQPMRIVVSHEFLPGGYQLIMGRQSVGLMSLETLFWYGMAGAAAIVLTLGLAFAGLLRRQHGQLEALAERRTAELRDSQARYERAMLGSRAGFWEWNAPTDTYFFSPRFLQLLGLDPGTRFAGREDFLKRAPFHPQDLEAWQENFRRALVGGEAHLSHELRVGDGTRWMLVNAMLFRDGEGKLACMTGFVTDVTERKRAAEALRHSEQRYARVMKASEDGFWEWIVATDEFYASPRMLAMYALPADTVFRGRADFFSRFPFDPEDLPRWRRAVAAHLAGESARVDLEVRVEVRGRQCWMHVSAVCQRDASGAEERWTGAVSDVTERRDAQEALRESEERLRQSEDRYARAMAAAEAGFWDWDVPKDEFYVSPRLLKMGGWAPGTTFAGRADFMQRAPFHPEDRDRWQQAVKALFASGGTRLSQELRVTTGPETRWYRLDGMCFRDAAGKAVRWTGSVIDVTERRIAEEALRASEERYALAVAGSDEGIFDADFATGRVFFSPRAAELTGLPPGTETAPLDEYLHALPLHPDDVSRRSAALRAHLAGDAPAYEGEFRLRQRDGAYRWRRIHAICLRDAGGRPYRMAGSITDVDARRRAEEALQQSEERYALAVAGSDDGVWDVDFRANRVFVSARARALAGLPAGPEVVAFDEFISALPLHPDDAARRQAAMQAHLAGEAPAYVGEFRLRQLDGVYRWRRIRGICVRDADGRPLRMAGSFSDVDARRLAEESRRRSEALLLEAQRLAKVGNFAWKVAEEDIAWSDQLYRMFEFEPGSALSLERIGTRVHPEDISMLVDMVERAQRGLENFEYEHRLLMPDGRIKHLHLMAHRSSANGEPAEYTGAVQEITARKHVEHALRLSEERYALAMDASEEGHFDWNVQTDEVFASDSLKTLLGLPAGAPLRSRSDMLSRVAFYPGDGERVAQIAREALAGDATHQEFEYRLFRGSGALRWNRVRWKILRGDDGAARRVVGTVSDVTERKQAADELRESEARFRALTAISSDWYWRQDENLRFTYLSEGVDDRAGWPGGEYIGRQRWEVPDIHLISCSWDEHRAVLAKRQPFRDLEYWRPGKDGPVYSSISGAPIFDEHGQFKGYQGVGRNITGRRRVEEALRLSEARYARAMDASADGLWEWNVASDELFISPRARELWGIPEGVEIRTRAELKARNLQFTEDTICECIAQRSGVEMTYSVLNQAGELRWVRCKGKVFLGEDGEPMLVSGSLTDVTERKLAADALRLSEEELRARQDMLDLAQKAASAVAFEWHVGPGQGENRWSADLEAMYGLEPGSYDGTYDTWKKLVFPADRPAVKAAIRRAEETGDLAAEYRIVLRDGAVRWLQAKGRMFVDAERKPARVVGFMIDVSDRHQAEEELRRLERQLRQAQRLEAMGTLAGGIAHDFNNILGAILGYGEMALRAAPQGSRLARDLDSIIVAGERGRALVDRVLAFSRSGVGERVPVHVEGVVREALDLISAKLPPNVALRAKLQAGRAAILGDATQVHQVVMNLATNAVQAMAAGGELRVSLGATRLDRARVPTIGIIDPGEYLVLDIADSGSGIAPDVLERIFDPFFTTKEVGTGTGLGLSLVHGIVAELGGAIDVASTPGAGSSFTVYLPRSGETVDVPQDEPSEVPRGYGQRVLVVDDEEALVRLATRTLEELGYVPVGFTSSRAALAAFRAEPQRFDALITDERMPGMSGSALIREVRGIRGRMPVVMMSGFIGGAVATRAREAGAEEVLKKPLSARDLAASLARVLQP
jgi:PAS domain S-box-containing protein